MSFEFTQAQAQYLANNAAQAYFDAFYQEADEAYDSHFDCYSTFDENDYEYQQALASGY